MRIPQSAERLKEAPAQVLRAVLSKAPPLPKEVPAPQALRSVLSKAPLPREVPAPQALRSVLSKDAPAQALRAVFSGVGQVLLGTEKMRQRAMGGNHEASAPPVTAAETTSVAQPVADGTTPSAVPTAEPEPAASPAPGTSTPDKASTAASAGAPPIPRYSELSVASLRARMRGLDAGQLSDLLSYERAHENRENVTGMFERRIAKLEQEGPAAAG
jgi:hypothetical protein